MSARALRICHTWSLLAWCVAACSSVVFAQQVRIPSAEELARELKPIPPRTPEEARRTIQVPKGLVVELVAAEPAVVDPVDMAFDAAGRLYVVEMRDYPFGVDRPEDAGRIRLLRDLDGDGHYETSTVFAAGLHWPTSVQPWRDGVLVLAPPEMWFLADRDGDGRADVREQILTGLGTQNVQALANGLLWSVDCRLYFANGRNGGRVQAQRWFRFRKPIALGGNDVRMMPPDVFELTTGGGQFGHSVDDYGRRFVCNNSDHARFVVLDRVYLARNPYLRVTRAIDSIAVEGASAVVYRISPPEPWRVIRTRLRVAGLVPGPVEHGGKAVGYFTSATGITVYRGNALGPEYYGNLFIGDVAGNLVHRKRLEPHGTTFRARRVEQKREFLASSDLWFRPVNFANGPDGALYICDMYREVVEHPASIPEFMKKHMNLTSGRDRGRIWRVRQAGQSRARSVVQRLDQADDRMLVTLLAAQNGWIRDTAQRLLFERDARGVVPQLRALCLAADGKPAARAAALWLLVRFGAVDAKLLTRLMRSDSPGLREQVVRAALELPLNPDIAALFVRAADDKAARVRLYAAYGLGEVDSQDAVRALARLLADRGTDRWLRTAALSSCSPVAELSATGRSRAASVLWELIRRRAREEAALASARQLAEMLAAAKRVDEAAEVLAAFDASTLDTIAYAAAVGLADGAARRGQPMEQFLGASRHAEAAVAMWHRLLDRAAEAITAGQASAVQVTLLAHAPAERFAAVAAEIFQPQVPASIQQHFVRVAGQVRRDAWYKSLLPLWRGLTPAVRRTLAESLLARPDGALALLTALASGQLAIHDLDPDVRNRLRGARDPKLAARAREVLGSATVATDRAALVKRYLDAGAARPGNRKRGKALYKEHCEKCHAARGQGGSVGPDLNTVRNRDPEALVIAILDPNREVAPEYLTYNVLLQDGRVLNGRIVSESATAITLGKADGSTETVLRANIEQIAASGQSLMPEGFEEQLKPADVADLVAYLLSEATSDGSQ